MNGCRLVLSAERLEAARALPFGRQDILAVKTFEWILFSFAIRLYKLDLRATVRNGLAELDQFPKACVRFRTHLPRRTHAILSNLK